jgi:hypothetical protein
VVVVSLTGYSANGQAMPTLMVRTLSGFSLGASVPYWSSISSDQKYSIFRSVLNSANKINFGGSRTGRDSGLDQSKVY